MASGITVSGGTGGIGANLDDMRAQAKVLETMTVALLDRARSTALFAVDPDLLSSAVLSPVTAVVAEEKIVAATGKLVLFATEAGVSAVFLEGAVVAYESVDKALAELATLGTNAVTFVAGSLIIPAAIVGGTLVLSDVAASYIAGYSEELGDSLRDAVAKGAKNPLLVLSPPGFASLVASSFSAKDANANASAILGAQLAALKSLAADHAQQLNVLLGQNAGIVDFIARGAPGLLTGLVAPLYVILGPSTNAIMTALTGVPWPPTTYEQAVQALVGAANKNGALEDGKPISEADLFTPPPILGQSVTVPHSISGLMNGSAQLDANDQLDGKDNDFARIRIVKIDGDPPHYIVQIPSTQSWDMKAGSTPNDLTSDTAAMAGRQTALASAVAAAMKKEGISSTDPVMLEGFSLGGITAGSMAADPNLHFNITHVVTAGAPIANFDIPHSVRVMSLEHNEDPVARLDGTANPDRSNWTTVHADAPLLASDNGVAPGIAGAHNADRYAKTAASASVVGNASVDAWQDSAKDFFTGNGTVTDYGAQRG